MAALWTLAITPKAVPDSGLPRSAGLRGLLPQAGFLRQGKG